MYTIEKPVDHSDDLPVFAYGQEALVVLAVSGQGKITHFAVLSRLLPGNNFAFSI